MALKQKDEKYTMFTFHENERSFVRRIHVVYLQDAEGKLHKLEADRLPNVITLHTGKEFKGRHTAEIILGKERKLPYVAPPHPQPFPQLRDLFNMGIGIVTFLLGSWFYAVAASCL